jgi:hypothetical protein
MITGTEHILTRAHWHWHHANEGCLQSCVTDILVSHKIEDNSGSYTHPLPVAGAGGGNSAVREVAALPAGGTWDLRNGYPS